MDGMSEETSLEHAAAYNKIAARPKNRRPRRKQRRHKELNNNEEFSFSALDDVIKPKYVPLVIPSIHTDAVDEIVGSKGASPRLKRSPAFKNERREVIASPPEDAAKVKQRKQQNVTSPKPPGSPGLSSDHSSSSSPHSKSSSPKFFNRPETNLLPRSPQDLKARLSPRSNERKNKFLWDLPSSDTDCSMNHPFGQKLKSKANPCDQKAESKSTKKEDLQQNDGSPSNEANPWKSGLKKSNSVEKNEKTINGDKTLGEKATKIPSAFSEEDSEGKLLVSKAEILSHKRDLKKVNNSKLPRRDDAKLPTEKKEAEKPQWQARLKRTPLTERDQINDKAASPEATKPVSDGNSSVSSAKENVFVQLKKIHPENEIMQGQNKSKDKSTINTDTNKNMFANKLKTNKNKGRIDGSETMEDETNNSGKTKQPESDDKSISTTSLFPVKLRKFEPQKEAEVQGKVLNGDILRSEKVGLQNRSKAKMENIESKPQTFGNKTLERNRNNSNSIDDSTEKLRSQIVLSL